MYMYMLPLWISFFSFFVAISFGRILGSKGVTYIAISCLLACVLNHLHSLIMLRSFVSEQIGIMTSGNDVMSAIVSLFIEVFSYGIFIWVLILFLPYYIIENFTSDAYSKEIAVNCAIRWNHNKSHTTTKCYRLHSTQRRQYYTTNWKIKVIHPDEPDERGAFIRILKAFAIRVLLWAVFLFVLLLLDCFVLERMWAVWYATLSDIKTMCQATPHKGLWSHNFDSIRLISEAQYKYECFYNLGKYVTDAEHCGWCELSASRIDGCKSSICQCVHECLMASNATTNELLRVSQENISYGSEDALVFTAQNLNVRLDWYASHDYHFILELSTPEEQSAQRMLIERTVKLRDAVAHQLSDCLARRSV